MGGCDGRRYRSHHTRYQVFQFSERRVILKKKCYDFVNPVSGLVVAQPPPPISVIALGEGGLADVNDKGEASAAKISVLIWQAVTLILILIGDSNALAVSLRGVCIFFACFVTHFAYFTQIMRTQPQKRIFFKTESHPLTLPPYHRIFNINPFLIKT